MRSMNTSERIDEMLHEAENYKWDAMSVVETWRAAKEEIWETETWTHNKVRRKLWEQTRCCNRCEQKVEKEDQMDKVHERASHRCDTDEH